MTKAPHPLQVRGFCVGLRLGEALAEISQSSAKHASGGEAPADMVVFARGVHPDSLLAADARHLNSGALWCDSCERDALRERLGELEIDRPIIVHCQVGLRGYLAARILNQHGYQVRNLDGGWKTWNSAQQ